MRYYTKIISLSICLVFLSVLVSKAQNKLKGGLIFSEILSDPDDSDGNFVDVNFDGVKAGSEEYLEFANISDQPISLDGLELHSDTKGLMLVIPNNNYILNPGEFLVFTKEYSNNGDTVILENALFFEGKPIEAANKSFNIANNKGEYALYDPMSNTYISAHLKNPANISTLSGATQIGETENFEVENDAKAATRYPLNSTTIDTNANLCGCADRGSPGRNALTVWTGSIDKDWFNSDNWQGGIPPASMDRVIISAEGINPQINSNVVIKSIEIPEGVKISLAPGITITVDGTEIAAGDDPNDPYIEALPSVTIITQPTEALTIGGQTFDFVAQLDIGTNEGATIEWVVVAGSSQATLGVPVAIPTETTSTVTLTTGGNVASGVTVQAVITNIVGTEPAVSDPFDIGNVTLKITDGVTKIDNVVVSPGKTFDIVAAPSFDTGYTVSWSLADGGDAFVTDPITEGPGTFDATIEGVALGATMLTATLLDGVGVPIQVDESDVTASVTITVESPSLKVTGDTSADKKLSETFTFDATPGTNGFTVSWESSDADVATVDGAGLVTAVGEGSATITATLMDGGVPVEVDGEVVKEDFAVTVELPTLTLNVTEMTIATIQDSTITATVANNGTIPYDVTWSSSDEGVVVVDNSAVDNEGKLTMLAPGTTTITASIGTLPNVFTETCEVTVQLPTVEVIGNAIDFINRETLMKANVFPVGNSVTWSSNDETVATVDQEGMVSFLKEGNVSITATMDDEPSFSGDLDIDVKTLVVSNVGDNIDSKYAVFPNPTEGELQITNSQDIVSVSIYNPQGQLVSVKTQNHNNIDISNLESGIYYIQIVTNDSEVISYRIGKN